MLHFSHAVRTLNIKIAILIEEGGVGAEGLPVHCHQFRSHKEQLDVGLCRLHVCQDRTPLCVAFLGAQELGGDVPCLQCLYLVLHECCTETRVEKQYK